MLCLLAGCVSHQKAYQEKPVIAKKEKPKIIFQSNIVFFAYEKDEYHAFKKLLPYLLKRQISAKLLIFGPALAVHTESDENIVDLSLLFSETMKENPDLLTELSSHPGMPWKTDVMDFIKNSFSASIIITGVSHVAQAQLTYAASQMGVYTAAFYNSFELPKNDPKSKKWFQSTANLNEVFLVGDYLIDVFKDNHLLPSADITVIGHPQFNEESINSLKKAKVYAQLKLSQHKKNVLFLSDYTYDFIDYLTDWIDVMASRDGLQGLIYLPAELPDEIRQQVKRKIEDLDCISVVPHDISETILVELSSLVVTHQSVSIGIKAASVSKPVIYYSHQAYNNILIHYGLAKYVQNKSFLTNQMHSFLDHGEMPQSWSKLGVPQDSIVFFGNRLFEILNTYSLSNQYLPKLEKMSIE